MSQEISFPPAWVQSTTQLSESPLSLLSELPDPPSNDTMLPNPAIVFAAKFPQRAYVLLPSMRKRRRMTQEPDAQRKTKRRKNNVERTTTSHGSATALDSDEDDRRVEEDYAAPLAQALANANSEQPQFTSKLVQMPLDLQAPRDSQSSSPKRQTASADSTPPVGAPRGASHTSRRGGKGKVSSRTILPFRPISTVPPDDIPNSRPTHRLPRATPMRAKPGRPPGIRDKKGPIAQKTTKASIPVPVQIPSTTGNADDTLQASQSPARAVELSNGRQMANASSSHNSASRPVGEGGSPDKLGASLRKLSKEVKSPRKELQNPRTEQDRLDTRLQTEYLERSHFELYSKEKEQETQRLTEELHEEKAARAQLQEQLRGEIEMREQREARLQADILHEAQMREQAVKQLHQLHADVRNAVEEAGKACLDRMERSQPQPPAAPSSPDRSSHWQAGLGDHVRMLVMDMLRSSGVNQYNHSPSTMVIPHLPNAVAPLRGGNMDGQVLLQPMEWAYSTIQSTFPQPHVMTTNPTYLDRQRRDNQISAVQSSRGHSSIRTGSRGGRMRTQDARISSVGSGFLEDSISHNGQNASTSTLPPPTAPRVHQPPENRARSVARDREPETPHHPYDDRTSRSRPERPRDHQTYGTHRSTGTRTDTPFSSRR
ncbi:hypothetical protein BC835DRAFT_524687 [Cytidiella melzeri]|nr:hypothetical protein BC835DRAFT_524687 [Cytidiella melzeri]